jgi:hypothetical protein
MEVWRDVLPEGSTVTGIDIDPACGDLGLPVHVGDVTDEVWLRNVLRGCWFYFIMVVNGVTIFIKTDKIKLSINIGNNISILLN